MRRSLVLLAALAAGPAAAVTATQDWPCIQPRQPALSLGQMWSGPPADEATAVLSREDPAIRSLAAQLALRRVGAEDATAMVAAYAATVPDAAHLTALTEAVVARINAQRSALIEGIGRYGHGQGAVAARIAERRARMDALQAEASPDFDAIDAEEEKLDWDVRQFEERRQMLTAVCESPVLLEQHAFAIARLIQARLPGAAAASAAPSAGAAPAPAAASAASATPAAAASTATPTQAP